MLKRFFVIPLLIIYALSSFGIGIKQFYCCGKLKSTSISLIDGANKKCGNGDDNNGCCKTKYKTFKVKDSHIAADVPHNLNIFFSHLHLSPLATQITDLVKEPKTIANASHAPPGKTATSVCILNCIFRI